MFHTECVFVADDLKHGPWKVGQIGEEIAKHSGFTKLSSSNWREGLGEGKEEVEEKNQVQ